MEQKSTLRALRILRNSEHPDVSSLGPLGDQQACCLELRDDENNLILVLRGIWLQGKLIRLGQGQRTFSVKSWIINTVGTEGRMVCVVTTQLLPL